MRKNISYRKIVQLEKDLTNIQAQTDKNSEENWQFRGFLKMNIDEDDLDRIVHKINADISSQIDCTECGNCCRNSYPILKKNDVAKISKGISLGLNDFTEKYLQKDEDGNMVFNTLPCPFLKDNKCTQYDNRPNDCKSFPHLHKECFVSRLWGVVENTKICPIVFNVYEQLKLKFPKWKKEIL